jgi:hypothetical protein
LFCAKDVVGMNRARTESSLRDWFPIFISLPTFCCCLIWQTMLWNGDQLSQ